MNAWAQAALDALAAGKPAALISVLATQGSAPRDAGARMVVLEEEVIGTVGGGNLEFQLINQGRRLLDQRPGAWRIQDYPLGPLLAQCCGGRVRVLLERLDPSRAEWLDEVVLGYDGPLSLALEPEGLTRHLDGRGLAISAQGPTPASGALIAETLEPRGCSVTVVGAGHVGQALKRALEPLPFRTTLIDTRANQQRTAVILDEPCLLKHVRALGPTDVLVIMTHDHALDLRLTRAAMSSRAAFIGLIGSATKRARFLSQMRGAGCVETDFDRLVCPIGLPALRGKEPPVIAASVTAQLLLWRLERGVSGAAPASAACAAGPAAGCGARRNAGPSPPAAT